MFYEQPLSCICCHELKWKFGVQHGDPNSEEFSERVDRQYVMEKHPGLFLKLGKYWICKACKSSKEPRLSAKTNLACPWEDVPSGLMPLNEVGSP